VDASVVLTMAFQEKRVEEIESVLKALETTWAVVPAIWEVEIANALVVGERRKRISEEKVTRFVEQLRAFPIEVDVEGTLAAMDRALPLARRLNLTAYDALYLDLAMRRSLPLATLDERLAAAATRASIKLMIR
jgi:predicted nucleic acid-binding protein